MAEAVTGHSIFDLAGRVALVTGGAGHLGRAMSHSLAAFGAHVFVAGRTVSSIEETADDICADRLVATALRMDVRDDTSVRQGLATIESTTGRLDVIVNNAYSGGTGNLSGAKPKTFLETHDVTTVAAHRVVSGALDLLRRAKADSGDASIINVASMYGLVSPDPSLYEDDEQRQPPDYGPAKAALIQYTRYLAVHLAQEGIRANSLTPGPFARSTDERFLDRLRKRVPLGRIGQPEELDGAVVFLASPASSFVTGANLVVDGGWTAW